MKPTYTSRLEMLNQEAIQDIECKLKSLPDQRFDLIKPKSDFDSVDDYEWELFDLPFTTICNKHNDWDGIRITGVRMDNNTLMVLYTNDITTEEGEEEIHYLSHSMVYLIADLINKED